MNTFYRFILLAVLFLPTLGYSAGSSSSSTGFFIAAGWAPSQLVKPTGQIGKGGGGGELGFWFFKQSRVGLRLASSILYAKPQARDQASVETTMANLYATVAYQLHLFDKTGVALGGGPGYTKYFLTSQSGMSLPSQGTLILVLEARFYHEHEGIFVAFQALSPFNPGTRLQTYVAPSVGWHF